MVGIYVARENQIINKYLEKNQLLLILNHANLPIYTRRKPNFSYFYNESLVYIQNITKPKFPLNIYREEIQSFSLIRLLKSVSYTLRTLNEPTIVNHIYTKKK